MSGKAASINNEGFEGQIAFLVEECGEDVEKMVDDAIKERS